MFRAALVRTEVLRATRPHGAAALERARGLLQTLQLVQLGDTLLDAAGMLDPMEMRSLDAIHLAAVALIAPELTALVTYDKRMAGRRDASRLPGRFARLIPRPKYPTRGDRDP